MLVDILVATLAKFWRRRNVKSDARGARLHVNATKIPLLEFLLEQISIVDQATIFWLAECARATKSLLATNLAPCSAWN